ncbi:hypothetical protein JCM11491_006456 [Sporobolomyces phaffii]
MSGFSSKSVFSTCSSTSTSSSDSDREASPTFSHSKIAWLSSVEVEEAMEKERKSILEDMMSGGKLSSTLPLSGDEGRKDWKRSVGPNTGRKLGKILSKSTSVRSLRISGPIHLKPLEDSPTSFNRTPPVSVGTNRSSSFKWLF